MEISQSLMEVFVVDLSNFKKLEKKKKEWTKRRLLLLFSPFLNRFCSPAMWSIDVELDEIAFQIMGKILLQDINRPK